MPQEQSHPNNECKCVSGKKVKALEKKVEELTEIISIISHKIEILERVIKTK
jgi:hypothetical protein